MHSDKSQLLHNKPMFVFSLIIWNMYYYSEYLWKLLNILFIYK